VHTGGIEQISGDGWVKRTEGRRQQEELFSGYGVSTGADEKVLELDSSDGCLTP
jgi:hypothetical protein